MLALPERLQQVVEKVAYLKGTIKELQVNLANAQSDLADRAVSPEDAIFIWRHQRYVLNELVSAHNQLAILRFQYNRRK